MVEKFQIRKIDVFFFFRNLDQQAIIGFMETGLLFPGRMLVCGWNLPHLKANGVN